ncbi:MAG: nucleotidyltransferase family protein [Candidatus Hodarchaeales archaeon]|jgi:predicted nucleotidyltransferase
MSEISELKEKIKEELEYIQEKYKVRDIGIFGSYVRGDAIKESDIDILVTVDPSIDLLAFIELEYYLSEKLGIKVDLVMKDALKPYIGKQILKEVIYI